jgi:chromosome segregation ATPase
MAIQFTDKELDDLDNQLHVALEDWTDAHAEHINWQANRIEELEAENQRLREKLMAVEKALCDIYDLWIEDVDPQGCQDAHDLVHKLLRDEK